MRSTLSSAVLVLGAIASGSAEAHTNGIAVAYPTEPSGVVVVDRSFTLSWRDSDMRSGTSTPTIDWFYTATMPPTFAVGTAPPDLEGTPIAIGIPEPDLANALVWDTSTIPSGAYWIWSVVDEPPAEIEIVHVTAFSPGVVVVAHPGDEVLPAVIITEPNAPSDYADQTYLIRYSAFDPAESGGVRLEAFRAGAADTETITLAADLDPTSDGSFSWDTSRLTPGDWAIRATIEDQRGRAFTAYSRFFISIAHADPPDPTPSGCSCTAMGTGTGTSTGDRAPPWWSILVAINLSLGMRRAPGLRALARRRSSRPARSARSRR